MEVPASYIANSITSLDGIIDAGFTPEASGMLVNCPVVPEGSVASLRRGPESKSNETIPGWYRDMAVFYFTFEETSFMRQDSGNIPVANIYVTFNINPGEEGGGPPSGFRLQPGSDRTRNVVDAIPGQDNYSPLWRVWVYDNGDFESVENLSSVLLASVINDNAGLVNCPIVEVD